MGWERRHAILGVLFGTYMLCYMDRMVMASAIPFIARDFHLFAPAQGAVLSAFFLGYTLMQLPGGLLADRFGPVRVMTGSIAAWSCFTALTGLASSFIALLVIRFLFGLSEGPYPPAASKTVALWFPQREIGRANGFQLAAVSIGAAIAPLLVAPLVIQWGWRSVFYTLLIPGWVVALIIRTVVRDLPTARRADKHPAQLPAADRGLALVLKAPAVLWCGAALFFANMGSWGLMNWLPTYLLKARGVSIGAMGIGASLPSVAGAIGYYLGGHVADRYFDAQRRIPIVFGLVLGGVMTYCAAVAPSGEWAIIALVLAFLFLFGASAGLFTLPLLMASQGSTAAAFGLVNTFGQVAAFLSPLIVGFVLNATGGRFTWVFYGFVGLFFAAACAAMQIRYSPSVLGSEPE
jgi:MFS family permease